VLACDKNGFDSGRHICVLQGFWDIAKIRSRALGLLARDPSKFDLWD
jgi:hypothetical protein